MSLQIYAIPSGDSIHVPQPVSTSLDDLRAWIEQTFKIPVRYQILLSSKGKPVKIQNFLTEREIFLYDRVLFSTSSNALNNVNFTPLPNAYSPEPFPDTLADQKSLKSWQTLFKERREWANELLAKCRSLQRHAEELIQQRVIIEHGVRLATNSIEGPIKTIEKKLSDFRTGLTDTSKDTAAKIKTLDEDLDKLIKIPALSSFKQFFAGQDATPKSGKRRSEDVRETTLLSFVDRASAKAAVPENREIFKKFNAQITDFETALENLHAQLEELKRGLDIAKSRSLLDDQHEPQKLAAEIEAVSAKVSNDCEMILGLRTESKAVSQASRIALLHTKNLLPGLMDYAKEMSELLRLVVEQKNAAVVRAADILQMVAGVESQQNTLRESVNSLRMSDEDWAIVDRISIIADIPNIYGSLLIEAMRRHEWVDRMRKDSANLAEEIAGYQEEEQRRRKKWFRSMKDLVPEELDGAVLGVEINLRGEESVWPSVSRKDLDEYLSALQSVPGMSDALSFLNDMMRELEKPTRQQVKRAKGFKNGSVHDAGFGKGSLLLRGEDETLVLKEVVTKLEDELKSNKSRVRKLEDLLHRQSHINRMSVTSVSPSQNGLYQEASGAPEYIERPPTATSPRLDGPGSRRPSGTSRRYSNQPEDKLAARRIVQLEAQLAEERKAKKSLEKELKLKDDDIQTIWTQLEEANSTKKDIMDNMEAQQKDFVDERKQLKLKAEELEEELDRVLGSRDNERTTTERRVDEIMTELEQTREDHSTRVRELEDQIQDQRSETNRRNGEAQDLLSNVFITLAPGINAPTDMETLMAEVEDIAHRSAEQAKELARAIAFARSENENLQEALESQKAEVSSLATKLDSRESDMMKAREELSSEKAKASSIAAELDAERARLADLRERFADGETGSEALRLRLAEEESKVTSLSAKLAEAKSHINSLDVELLSLQSRHRSLQGSSQSAASRLDERAQRAKEVTHRLYKQNARLLGLLETLGFAVTYDNSKMTIQRASRIGTSSVLPDQSVMTQVHITPAKKLLEDLSDLSSLLWMEKESAKEEATKFSEFLEKIDRFNIELFCEAVAKRMRDTEHTVRKWSREARAYRDKSRKYQSDAHGKIAYRSFKEGDLALFLPTRNQPARSWAAFNVNAPHYFLREQDGHRLGTKDWLVARITKVEEHTVDLSKTISSSRANASDTRSIGETSEGGASFDDDNPFKLGDGLRWYLLHAQEEKPGAPSTPGLGKTTVAAANVDAKGSIRMTKKRPGDTSDEVSRQLNKSLDSRRSSTNSKQSSQLAAALGISRPVSNEAIHDSPGTPPSPHRGLTPGHLRSTSAASSLRNVQNSSQAEAQADEQLEEEDGRSPERRPGSQPAAGESSKSPPKRLASPSKASNASPVESPTKPKSKAAGRLWDSLWQFDINLESGRKRKTGA